MEEDRPPRPRRPSLKTHTTYNNKNNPNWKDKLKENCYKRVREDRTRLLWKMRLPRDQSVNQKEFIKSAFQDIVSDELKKIKETSLNGYLEISSSVSEADLEISSSVFEADDALWEYDGLHTALQGECEVIMLEMQRIFYEDLKAEPTRRESESYIGTWEDEEDEYLARAVYEHMHMNDAQVHKEVTWCPICKQGKLQENSHLIYCTLCELRLNRGNEITLEFFRVRLAEAHAEHLDRGCRLKPEFCIETIFDLTALYIQCQHCSTFEVVI